MSFELDPLTANNVAGGDCDADVGDLRGGSRRRVACVALAGPAVSALLAIALIVLACSIGANVAMPFVLAVGGALSAGLGACDGLPFKLGGRTSDGLRALRAVRPKPHRRGR